ncbi:uncharacterized protein [Dermacentor albipictus]|uniref:uncharacterized protein n=1 Tax=Dermacentor albipictus TaxID=60249 RepID=UPI0038FC6CA0
MAKSYPFMRVMLALIIAGVTSGYFTCRGRERECTGNRRPSCFEKNNQTYFQCTPKNQSCREAWQAYCKSRYVLTCCDRHTYCDCYCVMPHKCLFMFIIMQVISCAESSDIFTCRHRESSCTAVRRPNCLQKSNQFHFQCSLAYASCRSVWLSYCLKPYTVSCVDHQTYCDCHCHAVPAGGRPKQGRFRKRW